MTDYGRIDENAESLENVDMHMEDVFDAVAAEIATNPNLPTMDDVTKA